MTSSDTLVSAFRKTVAARPNARALASSDGRLSMTWLEYEVQADRLAAGLQSVGVTQGDTVALLMSNRPEWQLTDIAALIAGATPFSLYTTAAPDQTADLIRRSGAKVLVAEASLLARLQPSELPADLAVVSVESEHDAADWQARAFAFADLLAYGARNPSRAPTVKSDDVATLIYTSGTTGPPKGVELTHAAVLFMVRTFDEVMPLRDARTVSYLPHAHIVDRLVGHYMGIAGGASVTTVANPADVFTALPDIRPTLFSSVPRIWQRLHAALQHQIDAGDPDTRSRIQSALSAAAQFAEMRAQGIDVTTKLETALSDTDDQLLRAMRASVGLDAVQWFVTGSAPLPQATHQFFAALGMPLHDLWGLSETVGVASLTVPGDYRPGTVGRPLPGTEIQLAADGEVLVRGPHLARGYRDDPGATATAFDSEGWFHTGDIGEWREGLLAIVGRKKDILINAGGENMSPSRIENTVLSASPCIDLLVVVGDGRPYNVALIVPDMTAVSSHLQTNELTAETAPRHPAVLALFDDIIASANSHLSRAERIAKYRILSDQWTIGSGQLTATLKIKREAVERKYQAEIEALYQPTYSLTNR
jgi:long-subunit acyl-CoA synthetase (AMP-forming)